MENKSVLYSILRSVLRSGSAYDIKVTSLLLIEGVGE